MVIGSLVMPPQPDAPVPDGKSAKAAKQFESLLIEQMLKSTHPNGSGWLGTGDDQSGQAAVGFAEEQFASAITAGGGLGLARIIEASLNGQKLQD